MVLSMDVGALSKGGKSKSGIGGFASKLVTLVETVSSTNARAKAKENLANCRRMPGEVASMVEATTSPEIGRPTKGQASWKGQRSEHHERQGQEREHAFG